MEYLKYDVMRHVNIILPEDQNGNEKVIYCCFSMGGIIDYKKYSDIIANKAAAAQGTDPSMKALIFQKDSISMKKKFLMGATVQERFAMSIPISKLSRVCEGNEFIIGSKTCYRFNCGHLLLEQSYIANVTAISVSIGDAFTGYDSRRAQTIRRESEKSIIADVVSNVYSGSKLPFPYTDSCVDWASFGFKNRHGAISECINAMTIDKSKMISDKMIIHKSQTNYFNYPINYTSDMHAMKQCLGGYDFQDCRYRIFVTRVAESKEVHTISGTMLNLAPDTDPSFAVRSDPKITRFEYFASILTSMCIWLGMFAILFNPVKCFCKPNSNTSETDDD